ncbi:hypothetical protein LTR56_012084 [Elasticomyces elasticus]|nr:hypothetical protein LTR56_012084 [Elasticomyces elasticus]KAK3651833.1 hypothetical protein LTR22_012003 [Elasticomyces elasticus]KAK4930190.1 hypothetical protein LTR49_003224 [Elasticomyces elasticus]KAK5761353.1 hypothetical protein LTS12_008457 [Elasticomyces elasticus]
MGHQQGAEALEQWFRDHGGYINPAVHVAHSSEAGYRWQAKTSLVEGTRVTTVPHSLALSYLNALVDEAVPFFRDKRHEFPVENLGFFYLMAQYIHREQSFWKTYIETLPSPDSELTTPLWFDNAEDLVWLEGTDVLHTMLARRKVYEQYYSDGITSLHSAGVDTTPYTWNLFRWSITMFTSRAFSSAVIRPQESKYWTTYKMNAQGRRQTVLLDMSSAPAEDLHFSVLFPVQDAGNHSNNAHVDWAYDPGRFSVSVTDPVEAGAEVFNNYGPKGNDELLMGYGFCIPDNPYDTVMLTLKPPPDDLQGELRTVHPGYFTTDGQWSSDKATFRLRRMPREMEDVELVFEYLPEALLELLLYILRHERRLGFEFQQSPLVYLKTDPGGPRYLPHIARMIVQSLAPKLQKLQSATLPPGGPGNSKQLQASMYRSGQMEIIQATMAALRTFTRSLLKPAEATGSRFVTLEGLLDLWSRRTSPRVVAPFIAGIEAISGTVDIDQLRQAGWEDDVMVLLVCYIYLKSTLAAFRGDWTRGMVPEYVDSWEEPQNLVLGPDLLDHAFGLEDLVYKAAEIPEPGLWVDSRWNAHFIAEMGGKMLQYESMTMMVPRVGGEGEEARLVLYVHSNE